VVFRLSVQRIFCGGFALADKNRAGMMPCNFGVFHPLPFLKLVSNGKRIT
jgi:hypothetical protein